MLSRFHTLSGAPWTLAACIWGRSRELTFRLPACVDRDLASLFSIILRLLVFQRLVIRSNLPCRRLREQENEENQDEPGFQVDCPALSAELCSDALCAGIDNKRLAMTRQGGSKCA